MASKLKFICPATQTPVQHGTDTGAVTPLPKELLSDQTQRLVIFSFVALAVWTIALVLDSLVLPRLVSVFQPYSRGFALELLGLIGSATMCLYMVRSHATPERKSAVSLGFLIVNAADIALLNAWAFPPLPQEINRLSWTTILILSYAMLAPSTPRRMLVASVTAASLDPLAFTGAYLLGLPTPPAGQVFLICWPNYVCAAIALIPSKLLHRVGRRLREAQALGRYRLVELLGHGGMGEVWRAQHDLLARSAAIKLVRPEVLGARNEAEAKVVRRRFEREAQATAALSSPHTIHVFDFGVTDDGTFYYVMELLIGRDLESLVREFGPIPADRVLYLLRQVCHSLADAHSRGLVHRDVKPANIYVCRMGLDYDFVKVLDFGLVKIPERGTQQQTLLTVDHTTTGTPAYMAPEIILGGTDVDSRADVYALGCVAYFLLTGQLVFEGDTAMKVLMQHVNDRPVPPSQRTELPIPRELDDLILACLEKDPNKRPQTAEELFGMAQGCRSCETWNRDAARQWWRTHLPEHTGPLSVITEIEPSGRVAAAL